jgi:hypothetical protein
MLRKKILQKNFFPQDFLLKNHKILRQFSPKKISFLNSLWPFTIFMFGVCMYVGQWWVAEVGQFWSSVDDGTTITWLLGFFTLHNMESLFYMWLDKPYWVLGNKFSEMKGVTHPIQSIPTQSINRHIFWPQEQHQQQQHSKYGAYRSPMLSRLCSSGSKGHMGLGPLVAICWAFSAPVWALISPPFPPPKWRRF